MHRTVGEEEIRATGMHAPKVEGIALIGNPTGFEMEWSIGAVATVCADVDFAHAQHHFGRTVLVLAPPGVPPAENLVRAWWALANSQRIARAVANVRDAHARIGKQHAVQQELIRPLQAEIACESRATGYLVATRLKARPSAGHTKAKITREREACGGVCKKSESWEYASWISCHKAACSRYGRIRAFQLTNRIGWSIFRHYTRRESVPRTVILMRASRFGGGYWLSGARVGPLNGRDGQAMVSQ